MSIMETVIESGEAMQLRQQPDPAELMQMHPINQEMREMIDQNRQTVIDILNGDDPRLLMIVGPCSLDDKAEAGEEYGILQYAKMIQQLNIDPDINEKMFVMLRLPPAKPRTHNGPRGLEQKDLVLAHELIHKVVHSGMPVAIELLNERHVARYGELLTLGWVGARNVQHTDLRHNLSAHPELPVLVKNSDTGHIDRAMNAIKTIGTPQENVEVYMPNGKYAEMSLSPGNTNTGLIFRGGSDNSPEEFETSVKQAANEDTPLIVDVAHGNAMSHDGGNKTAKGGIECTNHVVDLMNNGLKLAGIIMESYIHEGRDETGAVPGLSETDECIGIETTEKLLYRIALAHQI